MKSGIAINQDQKLEEEADIMGSKAEKESRNGETQMEEKSKVLSNSAINNIIQMAAADKKVQGKRKIRLWEPNSGAVAEVDPDNTQTIEELKRNGYEETTKSEKKDWVLKVGNSYIKNDVIVLQKVLVKSGYLDMPKDPATQKRVPFGTFGELTKQAVMKFQRKKGLKVDGIVGPGTWKALELPWNNETNEPYRTHHQYKLILNNNNIYNDENKAAADKTSLDEKTVIANIKSNLYILGYKNVYNDYKAARDQFLKEHFDNGHSLHADFIRMGNGDHYSTVLEWTNKALAHQISRHGKDAEGVEDKELNNYIDQYYKFALEYFNDSQVSWFTPYRSDVKYVWQFIDNNAKALGLSEYQVKLLKADYVFYSECTVENLSLMWNEMNNPFDALMPVRARRPGYKALNNAKGIRSKIAGKIKNNSIVKSKDTTKISVKDTAKATANLAANAKNVAKDVSKITSSAMNMAKSVSNVVLIEKDASKVAVKEAINTKTASKEMSKAEVNEKGRSKNVLKAAVNAEDAEVNEKNTPKNVPKVKVNAEDETEGTSKTVANLGKSYGKFGTVVENPGVKITGFSEHAVNQAITRGVTTDVIQNTVKNPVVVLSQRGGNSFAYVSNEAVVVIKNTGEIITTYGKSNFDAIVQQVLKEAIK